MRRWGHRSDVRTALLLGAIVGGIAYLLKLPGLAPSVWTDLAVATGTRPPADMFPCLWRALVQGLNLALGTARTLVAVPILGCVALGLATFFAYLISVSFLHGVVKIYPRHRDRIEFLIRLSSFFGTIAFMTSDAVWQAGQAGSPLILLMLAMFAAFAGVGRFLESGRPRALYLSAFVLGVFSADSPYAAVLSVGWAVVYAFAEHRIRTAMGAIAARSRLELVRWKITFMFVLGLLASLGGVFALYQHEGGMVANGLTGGKLLVACISQWIGQLTSSASSAGWLFVAVVVVSPFAMALVLVRRATDEEIFFPYHDGLLFIVLTLIAYSQLSIVHPLWIWNWTERTLVPSQTLRVFALGLSAAVVAMGVLVMCVYVFCRAHEAQQVVKVDFEEDPLGLHLKERAHTRRGRARKRTLYAVVVMAVMLAGLVGDRAQLRLRDERELIEAYLDETMAESEGCDNLFTDGRFDDVLRLRVKARDGKMALRGLYLPTSTIATYMLMRGLDGAEITLAARQSAATLLRTFVHDFPEKMSASGFQVGFEQWRRDLKETPPVGGLVARRQWPAGLREKGRAAAEALAARVLAHYAKYGDGNGGDRDTFGYVETVQWRLARMAQIRSEQFDLAGDAEAARAETARAAELDEYNASLRRIQADMVDAERRSQRSQSPREALANALRKADFRLAQFYAEQVLADEPTNRPANFAMGMALAEKCQFTQAVEHLTKSIAPGSKDPVLYNNLAMAQLAAGQLAQARTNALIAVRLAPKAAAVRDTMKRIEAAEKAR